jgi:hypothetical protein
MSYQPPPGPPPGQQSQYQQNQYQSYQQQPQGQQQHQNFEAPNLPPRRSDTDRFLPQGQDRTEQMETLQSYEASKPQTEADRDQETLQREFPSLDSSLIAAIYGDSGSLSATREMLQELTRTDG